MKCRRRIMCLPPVNMIHRLLVLHHNSTPTQKSLQSAQIFIFYTLRINTNVSHGPEDWWLMKYFTMCVHPPEKIWAYDSVCARFFFVVTKTKTSPVKLICVKHEQRTREDKSVGMTMGGQGGLVLQSRISRRHRPFQWLNDNLFRCLINTPNTWALAL